MIIAESAKRSSFSIKKNKKMIVEIFPSSFPSQQKSGLQVKKVNQNRVKVDLYERLP